MALGSGKWQTQNKVLPGTYINIVGKNKAYANSFERGIVAMPFDFDWGVEGEIFEVSSDDFRKKSLQIFGYPYDALELRPLRDLFMGAKKLYAYKLGANGVKASNNFGTAKHPGKAGNKLSISIAKDVDVPSNFAVKTYYDNTVLDTQVVANAAALRANDYIEFKGTQLAVTAKTPLVGGTNGTVSTTNYQDFLNKIEGYFFNVLACPAKDDAICKLFVAYTKRQTEENGAQFQTVVYPAGDITAQEDHEGIVELSAVNTDIIEYTRIPGSNSEALAKIHHPLYWVAGAMAGCPLNSSLTNAAYTGEYKIKPTVHTQVELEDKLKQGKLVFHNVNGVVKVLDDVNTLQTTTDTKGEMFKSNQTVRICNQIATSIAGIFGDRYLGKIPNNALNRASLWSDVVKLLQDLERMQAIEDFDPDTVTIEEGESKKAVVCKINELKIVNAMTQLYMTVEIR